MHSLVILTSLLWLSAAEVARAVEAKVDFQIRTQTIVWDEGQIDGVADAADSFTDLTKSCTTATSLKLSEIQSRTINDVAGTKSATPGALSRLGVTSALKSEVIKAYRAGDDRPTVLLFPELHLRPNVSPKVMQLHMSRAFDMLSLAEDLLRTGHRLLNAVEGPLGVPWSKVFGDFGADANSRLTIARDLAQRKWFTGAILLAEAFPRQIPFAHIDDNKLMVSNLLFDRMADLKASTVSVGSWGDLRDYVVGAAPERAALVSLDTFERETATASAWSVAQLRAQTDALCETRSLRMARNTVNAMEAVSADVAFLSVGVLHAHGVMRALENARVNYLVFSPNF